MFDAELRNDFLLSAYLTDTHWNSLGAFYGYKEIINSVPEELPGPDKLSLSDYDIKIKQTHGDGDIAAMINLKGFFYDYNPLLKTKNTAH